MNSTNNQQNKKATNKKATNKKAAIKKGNKKGKQLNNYNTVSGLPHSELIINSISAFTGLFIFLLGPYVVNTLGKPITAACFNLVPTGIIMGLFVATNEFETYFTSVLFVPMYNVVMNLFTYWLYKIGYLSALNMIIFQIIVWLLITFVSLFI